MTNQWLYLVAGAVFVLIAALIGIPAARRADERSARRTVREFVSLFPGRCLICSLHRYGYGMGFEKQGEPPPHACIERPRAAAPRET